jgi:hypothetical protein
MRADQRRFVPICGGDLLFPVTGKAPQGLIEDLSTNEINRARSRQLSSHSAGGRAVGASRWRRVQINDAYRLAESAGLSTAKS